MRTVEFLVRVNSERVGLFPLTLKGQRINEVLPENIKTGVKDNIVFGDAIGELLTIIKNAETFKELGKELSDAISVNNIVVREILE